MAQSSKFSLSSQSPTKKDFLFKYHPTLNQTKPTYKDCFKSTLTFDELVGAGRSSPRQSAHRFFFKDNSEILKKNPVKHVMPLEHLGPGLTPKESIQSLDTSMSSTKQITREKDTSFDNIGERPEREAYKGRKRFNNLSFSYSDRSKDPNKVEFRYHYHTRAPSDVSEYNVSKALKTIYEHCLDPDKSIPVGSQYVSERAKRSSSVILNGILNNLDAGGAASFRNKLSPHPIGKRTFSVSQKNTSFEESGEGSQIHPAHNNASIPFLRVESDDYHFHTSLKAANKKDGSNQKEKPKKYKTFEKKKIKPESSSGQKKRESLTLLYDTLDIDKRKNPGDKKGPPKRYNLSKIVEKGVEVDYNFTTLSDVVTTQMSGTPHHTLGSRFEKTINTLNSSYREEKNPKPKNVRIEKGFQSKINCNYYLNKSLSIGTVSLVGSQSTKFSSSNKRTSKDGTGK